MSYKIVADSSSNRFEMKGVDYAFVSLKVNCEDQEFVDEPGLDIRAMNRFLKMSKSRSGTSCPNVQEWLDAFGDAKEVYAVAITGSLSGSFSAAENAAKVRRMEDPEVKICVMDSLSTGGEMCLLMDKIKECKDAGMSFEKTEAAVRAYAKTTHLVFSLRSMNNLVKNGRISPAKAKIAGVLGIRAIGIASEVGTLQPVMNCRGERKNILGLFQTMLDHGYNGGKVIISHCYNFSEAELLREMILEKFKKAKILIDRCTALCSFYAEEGGLIIGYEGA